MLSSALHRVGSKVNYHHQLQEAWHTAVSFVTTGPGTESAGPGKMKLLNRSSFWWIVLTPVNINTNIVKNI